MKKKEFSVTDFLANLKSDATEEQRKMLENIYRPIVDKMNEMLDQIVNGTADKDEIAAEFKLMTEKLSGIGAMTKQIEDLQNQVKSAAETIEKMKKNGVSADFISKFDEQLNAMFDSEKFIDFAEGRRSKSGKFEFDKNGFENDVDSSACPIFATERMNSLKGYIALMILMYKESPESRFNTMLDEVKDRNFVEIRMDPHLNKSKLGIGLFDRVLESASRYTYMDETLWIPQHPDSEKYGEKPCLLCGGTGDLKVLHEKWISVDTREIRFNQPVSHNADQSTKHDILAEDHPIEEDADQIVEKALPA